MNLNKTPQCSFPVKTASSLFWEESRIITAFRAARSLREHLVPICAKLVQIWKLRVGEIKRLVDSAAVKGVNVSWLYWPFLTHVKISASIPFIRPSYFSIRLPLTERRPLESHVMWRGGDFRHSQHCNSCYLPFRFSLHCIGCS